MKMGTGASEGLTSVGSIVAAESDAGSAFGELAVKQSSDCEWERFKGYSTFKARLHRSH